ncbi:MAG: thioredoxin fold domain-containing protein [Alphaproteobacteria bacterium]|uniref:Thioredoxin fold domain-containing protein n=1 Tax=Candidatus Nitrobium versatile TaxID=2884831 RepID=A0A953JC40_9BACT|nr:thioredoxin fold domain-containing protein [Candidatus Nitrobium versatile]
MNTGPYSNEMVQNFLQEHFIPVKSQCFFDKPTELMEKFGIKWTPTLIIHDRYGKEHHRIVGYVPVEDLMAHLDFGRGKIFFNADNLKKAIEIFNGVIECHPDTGIAPEAVYYRGVAEYKMTHDAIALRKIYDTLLQKYPQGEWTRRSQPYASIPSYAEV